MKAWLFIIGVSALIGILTAVIIRKKWGIILAAAIPWLGLFASLYNNDSMWVIAQFFGGTVAAVVGAITFTITLKIRSSNT
jgi:hypothetical protein